jgi:hypothetical protein
MTKQLICIALWVGQVMFDSCQIPHDREIICETNFKKAKDLAYKNPTNFSALDSALNIVNRSMQCDSIKDAVIDLKINLLCTLRKYDEGSKFIDSLEISDFAFPYKKVFNHDNFIALNFATKGDTINRDKIYNKMGSDLRNYIKQNNLTSREFQEAFTELSSIPGAFTNSTRLKLLIDSLKTKYPKEERFLEFFRNR